jgi:uncharacterized protein (DUF58 family)
VGALLPLGLALGPSRESHGTRFVVVPRIAPVAGLALPEALRDQGGAVALASHTGESMEFMGLRPYREGDRPRDLHAPSWARLGVPVVREYQQEYFSRVAVVIDDDATTGSESDFEALISLAAGIIECLSRGEALIDVTEPGRDGPPLTLGRSVGHFDDALDHLADLEPGPAFGSDAGLAFLSPSNLASLLFVTRAWDAARSAWFEAMVGRGIACRAFVVAEVDAGDPGPAAAHPGVRVISPRLVDRAIAQGRALTL